VEVLLTNDEIGTVFRESYPNLCRFLKSIVRRDGHAEDIAQETFARLCEPRFAAIPSSEVRFWLFRVARNLALNELTRASTRQRFGERLTDLFKTRDTAPDEELVRSENSRIVRELLDKLPEHQRSALLLREQEDMSYREISIILSISESKVKVDIFRARQHLRELWNERLGEGSQI
jgi:RNA polymerase sigma-70 factor (ECF subfamily)